MRICFVYGTYPAPDNANSGNDTYLQALARRLVRAGHEVVVVVYEDQGQVRGDDQGVRIVRAFVHSWHWWVLKVPFLGPRLVLAAREIEQSWGMYQAVRREHRKRPFDIIELTETGGLFLSLFPPAPLCVRLHGEEFTYYKHILGYRLGMREKAQRFIQRFCIRRADVLISPSQAHAREIQNEIKALRAPLRVLPNPMTVLASSAGSGASPGADSKDPWMVLMVARLDRRKGADVLLKSVPRVLQECPEARFKIAGANHPSVPMSQLQALVDRLGIGSSVEFLGMQSYQQLAALYRKAALFVLPSYYEVFGLVLLEAMAYGLAVVAARAGGVPEVVEDGVNGLLVAPGNAEDLANALVRILRDPELRQRLGKNGRERARSKFDLDKHVAATLEVYQWVLNSKSRGKGFIPPPTAYG